MASKELQTDPQQILATALTARQDGSALESVRLHKQEIIDWIDATDGETIRALIESSKDAEWSAAVFHTLDSLQPALSDEAAALRAMIDHDEAEIGLTFRDWIERRLPEACAGFAQLQSLPLVGKAERTEAERSPSSLAAGRAGRDLARFGVTPLTFFYAAQAVSNLVREAEQVADRRSALTKEEVIDEVAATCHCSQNTAVHLLAWLSRAADYVDVFPGFKTEKHAGRISFHRKKTLPQRAARPVVSVTATDVVAEMPVPLDDDSYLRA
jgi:hypothetical protein